MGRRHHGGWQSWSRWLAALILVLLVPVICPLSAGEGDGGQWRAELETSESVDLEGTVETQSNGSVVALWSKPAQLRVSAHRVTVEMEVSEGQRVQLPGGVEAWQQLERRSVNETFSNVTAEIDAWRWPGTAFVEQRGDHRVSAEGRGTAQLDAVEDELVLWAGDVGGGAADEDGFPSYQAHTEEPVAFVTGGDEATVTGDFSLFVNNVTVTVAEDGEASWSNWTGFRSEGQGPGEHYEMRITRLLVERGRLEVEAEGDLAVFDDEIALTSDGDLQAASADGTLTSATERFRLEDDWVQLRGSLSGTAQPSAPRGGSGEYAPLALDVRGDPDLVQTSGKQPVQLLDRSHDAAQSTWWWASLPIAVATVGVVAMRRPDVLRPLPGSWRERLFERWKEKGLEREMLREPGRAATIYRRLTLLEPGRPMAWFLLARARYGEGELEEVVSVVDEGRKEANAVPTDLLEFQTLALAKSGRIDEAVSVIEEIAEEEPRIARLLVEDTELEDTFDERASSWWTSSQRRGHLDGYV